MKNEVFPVRAMVFLAADALLAELQRGASVTEINVDDKIKIEIGKEGKEISLLAGDNIVVSTGEIKNYVLFHHKTQRALGFESKQAFEKVVKGGEFGESYIYDIPGFIRYNFQEVDERARKSYVHLLQALSWMLRSETTEWTVA